MNTLEIIEHCAQIPSFSSYEERIHPYIKELLSPYPEMHIEHIPQNNLLITVPGNQHLQPIALSAHLDKIDHFGDQPTRLPTSVSETEITGQLDDTVGLGICLSLAIQSQHYDFPTLYLLLSEMEESFGLKRHPERLKNQGKGLSAGIGARHIAQHLIQTQRIPSLVITLDTTPLFKGASGIALYSKHWEKNDLSPTPELIAATEKVERFLLEQEPCLRLANNTNDYLTYGQCLNQSKTVPCIALEPSIYPYHQKDERVFLKDIQHTETLTKALLLEYR